MALIDDVTFFALIFLIGIFLLKLYNVLQAGGFYDVQLSIVSLAVGTICYMFIQVGLLLNLDVEFHVYLMVARVMLLMIWIFWVVELYIYIARQTAEVLNQPTRMRGRRFDRMNRGGY